MSCDDDGDEPVATMCYDDDGNGQGTSAGACRDAYNGWVTSTMVGRRVGSDEGEGEW